MIQGWINRLRGQVRVRLECAYPERVLNLCSARGIAFWDLNWETPASFTCVLTRQDYHALRRAVKQIDCRLSVVRKEGVPYFLLRFRHRQALWIGLTICSLALFIGSFFVWDFQVEGNKTVPTETILRALERQGVGIGSFGLSLDGEDIRNHVLLEVPELSWITVNVSGCRAKVQVVERIPAPQLLDKRKACNVVARRDGLILQMQTMGGVPCVLRDTLVSEGQLLISGLVDTETFGPRVTHGMGTVKARTWYDLTANAPLTAQEKRYTGREKTFASVIFGTHRIKFFSNSSIEGANYDKITKNDHWHLFGIPLPIHVEREICRFYEWETVEQDEKQLQDRVGSALGEYLASIVTPFGEVEKSEITARRRGEILTVTLRAECVEEIGRTVPILTE